MTIKISIISICFNNLNELLATCASVDKQMLAPHEHWIIDGSSTTEIRNYLASHPQPAYRKWITEKDNGIADAFNKGVQSSSGDILNMLNSADYYIDENVLANVAAVFEKQPVLKWLHSKYQLQRGGVWVTIGKPFEKEKLYRGMRSLSHQTMFIKKELHDKYGLYDTSLCNAMDYDFVCRISNEPMLFLEKPLIVYAPGGTTDTNYLRALQEARQVYEKYFGYSIMLVIWQWRLKCLYYIINSPVGGLLYKIKVWLRLENL
jgi:glycosyltransferase involved in cell wall biosynthesis